MSDLPLAEDLEMLQRPGRWPHWPVLPVKRPDPRFSSGRHSTSFNQFGLMVAVPERRYHVYLGHRIDVAGPGTLAGVLDQLPRVEYSSYEEILVDGWVVD